MSSATERRTAAIGELFSKVILTVKVKDAEGHMAHRNVYLTSYRPELAEWIRDLAKLGRTDRWADAIEGWAQMVENDENPLEWAFIQGSIFAGHAVD